MCVRVFRCMSVRVSYICVYIRQGIHFLYMCIYYYVHVHLYVYTCIRLHLPPRLENPGQQSESEQHAFITRRKENGSKTKERFHPARKPRRM